MSSQTQTATSTRVAIMAGGTGGHVYPGLAVAKALQQKQCDVAWLGTQKGIEARVVPAAEIPIHYLSIQGVRGKGLLNLCKAPLRVLSAIAEARKWMKHFQPNAVVGLGGYVAGPGGIAAWTLRIPLIIHEQNARAGTTNKILRHFAKRVLVAFDQALPNSEWIGNPVREAFTQLPARQLKAQSQPLHVLVLGGSLGAKAINELMPVALASIARDARPVVRHQTGEQHWQATQTLYDGQAVEADVVPFIEDMAASLEWADLVICRAGALTISELSAAGVASILIPFPYAIDDHQTANAQWLVDHHAALLKPQSALTHETLAELIAHFDAHREELLEKSQAARACAKLDATERFTSVCLEVAHG